MEVWLRTFFILGTIFAIVHLLFGGSKKIESYAIIFKRILELDEEDTSYSTFTIPKKDGTLRTINAPNSRLKDIQCLILEELQKNIVLPNYITGFRKKMSIKTNAKKHIGKKIVINLDIKDFFSNVTVEKLTSRLTYLDIPKEVIDRIDKLCFYDGRLPQGASTSPFLANFIFIPVDEAIISLLRKYDPKVVYSRYADNITISSNIKGITNAIRIIEQGILPKAGFELNRSKTNISRIHSRQTVTGLVVNEKVGLTRSKYKILRAKVNNFFKAGTGKPKEIAGNLAFLRMVDNKKYLSLKAYYKKKFPLALNFEIIFPDKKQKAPISNDDINLSTTLNDVGVTSSYMDDSQNNS